MRKRDRQKRGVNDVNADNRVHNIEKEITFDFGIWASQQAIAGDRLVNKL